jgi:hypothetical protein
MPETIRRSPPHRPPKLMRSRSLKGRSRHIQSACHLLVVGNDFHNGVQSGCRVPGGQAEELSAAWLR